MRVRTRDYTVYWIAQFWGKDLAVKMLNIRTWADAATKIKKAAAKYFIFFLYLDS